MDPGVQVDKILYALGSSGKYQRIQLALCFLFTLENSFHLIAAVYIGYRPSYQCQDINTTAYLQRHDHNNISDINVQYDKCKINIFVNSSDSEYQYTEGCLNGYSYDIPDDRSTVTEVERSELAKTMIMLGQAVGAVIFSPIADSFLDESLRWLVANGKRDQTEKVLKKACRMNNVSYESVTENVLLSKEINIIALEETHELNPGKENGLKKEKVERYTVFTLLKHKRILLGSVVLWIAWITNTLTYYGLMLTTSKLSGDRFLNNVIASLAEYPAVILQQSLINRIGRKSTLVIFHGIAGVSLVLATVCTTYGSEYSWLPILGTVFSFVGRFAITGSFSTVFLYTPELYPTNLRNVGLGMASTVARAGSMMSPFAITLAEYISWGPAAVFATMNVIVTISLLTLPETMGRELPTTITELKDWYKDKGGHGTKAKH
ncbi:OCTN [Mytilus edulis]|uniref:SLC22A4_5 n=1 Tax=Mytilus edulis TaxID=6550 RepID=A0A8S3S455_MYTED|nr:OCTN [Mytilus edulis]